MSQAILVVIGSHAAKEQRRFGEQVAAAPSGRGQVETIFLQGMDIRPCTACDACRKKLKKDCIIQTYERALSKMKAADGIVIAAPSTGSRSRPRPSFFHGPLVCPGGDDGYDLAGKKFGIVLAYADATLSPRGSQRAAHISRRLQLHRRRGGGHGLRQRWKAGEIKKNKASWRRL